VTDDQHEPEAERQGPAPQPFQYASQEQLANERAFAATLADTRDIDVVGRSTTDDRQYLALEMQRRLKVATENLTAEEVRSRESSERLIGLDTSITGLTAEIVAFRTSSDAAAQKLERLTNWLIGFTAALLVMTVVLVILTAALVAKG
jgi:hypothetical protein